MGRKALSEMTIEELWQLFPIFLVEHNPQWDSWHAEEEAFLRGILEGRHIEYSHIGSTAIHGIWAKNIVDIMMEVDSAEEVKAVAELLADKGYGVMYIEDSRAALNKGYTEQGFAERVFHLHIRVRGDNDELYFRDYLNEHPKVAKDYEELKLSLWKRFEHNRDGYTDAKGEFIKHWTEVAKAEYKDRYK